MTSVDFFTPIRYQRNKTCLQHVQEGIEDYFYLGGKYAYVIPTTIQADSQGVKIRHRNLTKIRYVILSAIKIISYATVIIPLVMLSLKIVFRATHKFHIVNTGSTVVSLMDQFTKAWNDTTYTFDFPDTSFDLTRFTNLLSTHAKIFGKEDINPDIHFGFIEKYDLDPAENPRIYMRADLHGDLKSLIENLRSLQKEGLLDENYKCKPGVHLVFLGDYCDRGQYGTQILEMLMRLREENPEQIHLIRGNHEDTTINNCYGSNDPHLMTTLRDDRGEKALKDFYSTMSLTTYFSVNSIGPRDYVQCTHGLFEPTMDPAPLLDQGVSGGHLPVPKKRQLSDRVRKIADGDSHLSIAAQRVNTLFMDSRMYVEDDLTIYNWANVSGDDITTLGSLGSRYYALNARDIRHCLDLSSEQHRVQMLFRGHEHAFQHLLHEGHVLVTTLPVGVDCPGYSFPQPDRAYIIEPKKNVADWVKQALLRVKNHTLTTEITPFHALTSSAV